VPQKKKKKKEEEEEKEICDPSWGVSLSLPFLLPLPP
jgi:hypothetical protein